MIQERLPKQISYPRTLKKGFPSLFKQWVLDPVTNNRNWQSQDIVRFLFQNQGQGVFDPFRSYMQITVSCSKQNTPVGLLQIDNSAQSFVDQMVLYSNSRQVERITNYSVIAAYLNDIGRSQIVCQGRQQEGLGFGSFQCGPIGIANSPGSVSMRRGQQLSESISTQSIGTIFPTIGDAYPHNDRNTHNSLFAASKIAKGHVTNSNPILSGSDYNSQSGSSSLIEYCLKKQGYANNLRADYLSGVKSNRTPQATSSVTKYQWQLAQNVSKQGGQTNAYPFKYNPKIPYQIGLPDYYFLKWQFDHNQSEQEIRQQAKASNFGFTTLYSPMFNRGAFQPFISPTIPQCSMDNGFFQAKPFPISRKRFKIPLISGVMGILNNPQQSYLLPLQSISSALLQITLDPYAMFTSGYSDYCQLDDLGMMTQQKRSFVIERIQYKLHTYFFIDSGVSQYIKTSLFKQINLTTTFISLGNQFQIPGNSPVNNSYIVGTNTTNLTQLICLFVSNDYQAYSFCRKHFRLSNNITRFWAKLGVDYWPPQPYKGNGGNFASNNMQDDNSIFVQNIYWSNDFMFSSSTPIPKINIYNFAVNQRPYNPQNRNTFYDPQMYNDPTKLPATTYEFTEKSINADTAMGMTFVHQNRVRGAAAYVISFTPYAEQQGLMRGINVSGQSNFQVVFQSSGKNPSSRDQTLNIFCQSTGMVKYTPNGIETYGR